LRRQISYLQPGDPKRLSTTADKSLALDYLLQKMLHMSQVSCIFKNISVLSGKALDQRRLPLALVLKDGGIRPAVPRIQPLQPLRLRHIKIDQDKACLRRSLSLIDIAGIVNNKRPFKALLAKRPHILAQSPDPAITVNISHALTQGLINQ